MHETIAGLVAQYGYLILFALVALESTGVPLPGESALVTSAAFAALGHLDIFAVVATASAGAIIGDNGGYWIGRKGGMPFVQRFGRFFRLKASHLERVHAFFERHGARTVFIGRFVAVLRTWAAIFAGAAEMPYGAFMLYNALGGILWATLFGTLGFVFGRNLPRLEHYLGRVTLISALLVALLVGLVVAGRSFEHQIVPLARRLDRWWRRVLSKESFGQLRTRYPRLTNFLAARMARGEYLGLHLTIGFLVSVLGLWIFSAITEDVVSGDSLTEFDVSLHDWMRAHALPIGYRVFVAISRFGSGVAMAAIGVAVGLILVRHGRWIVLGGWVAAFAGGGLLDHLLKTIIQRPRPPEAMRFLFHESWSFPSGHSMGALVGFGMLTYVLVTLWVHRRPAQIAIGTLAASLVLAIGLSRIYLGVHYFSDVMGGFAAGLLWLSACVSGVEVARRFPMRKGRSAPRSRQAAR
jgi:membrane protein DedA with SNARE-associated domain/membrane-associated phospholipid phosphatase